MALGFVKKIFSFGRKSVEEIPADEAENTLPEAETVTAAGGEPDIPPPPEEPEPPQPSEEPAPASPPETPPSEEPSPDETPQELPPAPDAPEPVHAPDVPPSVPEEEPPVREPAPEPPAEVPPEPNEVPSYTPTEVPPGNTPAEFASAEAKAPEHEATATPEPAPEVETPPRPADRVLIGDADAAPAAPEPEPMQPERRNWIARLTGGLSRSSRQLTENIAAVFTRRKLDEDTLEELEDILLQADLGVETAMRITDTLASGRYGKEVSGEEVRGVMAEEIAKVLEPVARPLELDLSHKPHVVLVVGVNGTGKTTTIGKLAAKLRDAGLKVTLGAGDTFRAAAIEQLKIWADRTGSTFVGTKLGADAAGLAWDAFQTARDNGSDVVIIDTAGRLQNKAELMDELAKIVRVLQKHDPEAPHTVLQTLDATTGQNALNQVEIFRNVAGVNGLVMTKLDGTARGGILVAISAKFKLPVYFIGVGEGVDDLEPFRARDFANAIAGVSA
ncbi:signal recognition particle-docking protein FtsY [Oricola thermophila]|uniref:Signal recognition particle receptor FtsY n=1 Tax=Oricola thermophila TaxID=2742145 RepID=A0A6N1VG95_9HYPH|nr:signal recognition particle-docking protein FtsY [Oricola thermophila]QKV19940.1 signal recognition particle-docking protein FtsY [Oricola thermophila]